MPMLMTFCVLHYYDARIRKEGYDVEILARTTPVSPVLAS
jgi:hypothetical protein